MCKTALATPANTYVQKPVKCKIVLATLMLTKLAADTGNVCIHTDRA